MNPADVIKKTIAILVSLGVLFLAYFGSFLPLQKSKRFIRALGARVPDASALQASFSGPLDLASPIGQEELVRNTAASILDVVQRSENPQDIASLVSYVERYYRPLIASGRGMSFSQNLYVLGLINEVALLKTRNPQYFVAAKDYFLRGLERSPRRPQFLLGILDMYLIEGNGEAAKRVGEEILRYWPTEERTKAALQALKEREAQKQEGKGVR